MENIGIGTKKPKKGLIKKTLDRCKSLGSSSSRSGFLSRSGSTGSHGFLTRSNSASSSVERLCVFPLGGSAGSIKPSWPSTPDLRGAAAASKWKTKRPTIQEGWFAVYVGLDRRRFVIKTSYINHPLFKSLLEEAERVYGYHSDGPLVLPCDVDMFYQVLSEMDDGEEVKQKCTFAKGYGSYRHLSPSRDSVPIAI